MTDSSSVTGPMAVSSMEPALYYAAKEGDIGYIRRRFENGAGLAAFLTPQKDTILHVAACFKQADATAEILRLEPALLLRSNADGDTPLHIAARSELNIALFPLLLRHYHADLESGQQRSSTVAMRRAANSNGNTALHEAIRNRCAQNALRLLEEEDAAGLANCVNRAGESPLYLAASLVLMDVAARILDIGSSGHAIALLGPNGQTPLHAAASRGATDVARLLCRKLPSIVRRRDDFGRTALHHCVSSAATETAAMLLEEVDYKLAYIADEDGLTPLITAATFKLWDMVDIVIRCCPDCAQIRDGTGQNVLHIAMRERLRPMHIINHPEVRRLLNGGDDEGNTPLHITIKSCFYLGAVRLLRCEDIDARARNKEGLTALDLLEISKPFSMEAHQNLVKLMNGRYAVHGGKSLGRDPFIQQGLPNLEETKLLANTLAVVATLVCTISFAAAFTFPGGYDSSNGTPFFGKNIAFQIFFMADAAAICASLSSAYMLVWGIHWGALGEPRHLYSAVKYSHAFLNYAFMAMLGVFTAGMYLVTVEKCMWLTITIVPACFTLLAVSVHPFFVTLADLPRYWVWLTFEFLPGRADPTSTARNVVLSRDTWEDRIEELVNETWRSWFPKLKKKQLYQRDCL